MSSLVEVYEKALPELFKKGSDAPASAHWPRFDSANR